MFALVSFYKAFSGEDSCGCFGKVPVNPWITTSFDLLIIALLFYFKPNNIKNIFNDIKNINTLKCFFSQHYSRLILYVGVFLLLGGAVYTWIEQKTFDRLEHAGQVLKSNVVQLTPETWLGKELPLRDYIIDGREIMRGRWTVLLVRPGCEHCAKVKKQLIQNAKQDQDSIAILDIVAKIPQPDISENIRNYRLHSDFTWVADTPVVLFLQDGIVRDVKLRE
jgi:thiol-disulfide isomerase/thioredoxin